jgi:hypothetical protein
MDQIIHGIFISGASQVSTDNGKKAIKEKKVQSHFAANEFTS